MAQRRIILNMAHTVSAVSSHTALTKRAYDSPCKPEQLGHGL